MASLSAMSSQKGMLTKISLRMELISWIAQVKCDGKQPCYNCSSRNQDCGFPLSNDNASASRQCVIMASE